MLSHAVLVALGIALIRAAPVPANTKGTAVTVNVDAASQAAVEQVTYKELCYLEFTFSSAVAQTRYTKDQLIKDTDGKDVYLNDGYKKDESGRDAYYISYCYASSSIKGTTSESKTGDSTTTSNPFADIIDGLDIQSNAGFGGSGGLLASLVGGGGLLKKRQLDELDGPSGLDDSSFGNTLGGSSFGDTLGGSSFGDTLGGSPMSNSLGSPLSGLSSFPLDSISSPVGNGITSPADNFDVGKAIQGVGSSDKLAGQNSLFGGTGRNFGNVGEGRTGGLVQEDAALPSPTSTSSENKPTGFHLRQTSVDESILHSDSRNTGTSAAPRIFAATHSGPRSSSFVPRIPATASATHSAPRSSSFVPVQLAQPGGPTIAVAMISQPTLTATAEGQSFSTQTIQPTAVA